MSSTLYIVATPIGNLEDITLRALRVLREVDLIAAEDTREALKLLRRYGIEKPLISLHDHNETARIPEILRAVKEEGRSVALISDAGTPLLNDPGFPLVRAAAAQGIAVVPLPGANAAVAALMAAGLPTNAYWYGGYLPARGGERRRFLADARDWPCTLVFFETPHRIGQSLIDLIEVLGDRHAALAREMTKAHETFYRGRLSQIAAALGPAVKGEMTLVIEGRSQPPREEEAAVIDRLRKGLTEGRPLKALAAEVAAASGWGKNEVYERGLALKVPKPNQ